MFNEQVDTSAQMKQLLKDTVDANPQVAQAANELLKAAITSGPIKSGILYGDIATPVFSQERFEPGIPVEYPFDIIGPNDVKLHIAYATPWTGYVPLRSVEADYMTVKTFMVRTSVDWAREMARNMRWNIAARALQVAEAGITRRRNDDAWHTLLVAGNDRGVATNDSQAANGLFTKRLISLMQVVMRRSAGGNSTSMDKGRLTHLALSPEGLQDIRAWDFTQVDDVTRREIFVKADDMYPLTSIFGVNLVDLDELGVGQLYQLYYTGTLGGTISGSKPELVVGLDLGNGVKDSFVMPWVPRENGQFIQMYDDPTLSRFGRIGYWMECRYGVAVLDNRRIMLGGF